MAAASLGVLRCCAADTWGGYAHLGHYICDAYDRASRRWKRYDDAVTTPVGDFSAVLRDLQPHGYLFFYVASPPPSPPPPPRGTSL
jgi:ubiquitin C-terminal hydrolase